VTLQPPTLAATAEFVAAMRASRTLHRPWTQMPDTAEKYAALSNAAPPTGTPEISCAAGNGPSIELVRRCGFAREGYSPRYLKIGGRWCDHERWAMLVETWREQRSQRAAG
jgi:hypothetical protein